MAAYLHITTKTRADKTASMYRACKVGRNSFTPNNERILVMRFYIACIAFYNILFNKTHIYASPIHRSVVATRKEVVELQCDIANMCNYDINQHNLLNEAKKLIEK